MNTLFASGHVVDLILALMAVEGAALLVYFRRTARGVPPVDLMINLAAGAALMLALRAALVGATWQTVAGALLMGLIAHVLDLGRRWR